MSAVKKKNGTVKYTAIQFFFKKREIFAAIISSDCPFK